jgi:short-subunit dehydrogenase
LLRIMPEQVVAEGLAALEAGRAVVFPGKMVSWAGTLFRMMPRGLMRWINRRRFAASSDQ